MTLRASTGVQNQLAGNNTTMVTGGTFEGSISTSWSDNLSGATAASSTDNGVGGDDCLRLTASGAALGTIHQDIATVVGQLYLVTLYFKVGTSSSGKFYVGSSVTYDLYHDSGALSDATWTQYKIAFIATTTTSRITLETTQATGGTYTDFDEVTMVNKSCSLQDIFNLAEWRIYSGTQPADPDNAPAGTLLVTIKNLGTTGITWKDATDGVISKTTGETWNGVGVANGTAGWFRLCLSADAGGSSTTAFRIDGSCGTVGGDLNFDSLAFASGATQTISDYELSIPMEE